MVAIPWKFESSYPHQFWGCSSVDRALRSHRRGRGFESHQLHQVFIMLLIALPPTGVFFLLALIIDFFLHCY